MSVREFLTKSARRLHRDFARVAPGGSGDDSRLEAALFDVSERQSAEKINELCCRAVI